MGMDRARECVQIRKGAGRPWEQPGTAGRTANTWGGGQNTAAGGNLEAALDGCEKREISLRSEASPAAFDPSNP